ncbi:MAG: tRNA 4-thiouridine(8) synthase ThiI [Deltaproteobacteria bacterium]|nr:tRNA 4-thiouridine(8) synthase ThiI [Deltaproteobacteria bacterium]
MNDLVVLRYGEIFLKGKNRSFFISALRNNLKRALEPLGHAQLKGVHGRFLVFSNDNKEVIEACRHVFGITSISPAVMFSPSMENAITAGLEIMSDSGVSSFKVKVRRSDKSFPVKSPEIAAEVGGQIHTKTGIKVDLHNPEVIVEIEIGKEISFISLERIPGPGGLPVGVSSTVELLLSAGIDSPVAGYMMLKRGASINATTFYSPPWVGEESLEKAISLSKVLSQWGAQMKLTVVKYGEAQKILRKCRPDKLAVILYRRLMMRTTGIIAARNGAKALVTGESLGQVASQTLENMIAIDDASPMLVLRPLVTWDKSETIEWARKIGTYDISILPHEDSCTLFMPPAPETKAKMDQVIQAEKNIDTMQMAQDLADDAIVINI